MLVRQTDDSASEVKTLWQYTNLFIIIIIIMNRQTESFQWMHRPCLAYCVNNNIHCYVKNARLFIFRVTVNN